MNYFLNLNFTGFETLTSPIYISIIQFGRCRTKSESNKLNYFLNLNSTRWKSFLSQSNSNNWKSGYKYCMMTIKKLHMVTGHFQNFNQSTATNHQIKCPCDELTTWSNWHQIRKQQDELLVEAKFLTLQMSEMFPNVQISWRTRSTSSV